MQDCQDFLRPSQLHSVCLVNDYEDGNGGKDKDQSNKEQEEWLKIIPLNYRLVPAQ